MKRFIMLCLVGVFLIPTALRAVEVTPGGSLLFWNFWWQNTDFNADTEDGDNFYFLFGNATLEAKFDENVTIFINPSAIGVFGFQPCLACGAESPTVTLHQLYMDIGNIFDTPISLRIGKARIGYDDLWVLWDGGAEGVTGIKFNVATDMLDWDFFAYRLSEEGGWSYVFYDTLVPADQDLYGTHATVMLLDGMVDVNGYFYNVKWSPDNKMYFGGRFAGDVAGFKPKAEFVMLTGSMNDDVDYSGMAYAGQLKYSLPMYPVTVGGGYSYFSGDDPDTDDKIESFHNVLTSVSLYDGAAGTGFLGWSPAHMFLTGGFVTDPHNLSVINGHVVFEPDPVTIRVDYNMFSLVEAPEDVEKGLGTEISGVLKLNYRDVVTIGTSVGYYMPGDFYGEDLDATLGGVIFFNKFF
jgi:hypothetical protein